MTRARGILSTGVVLGSIAGVVVLRSALGGHGDEQRPGAITVSTVSAQVDSATVAVSGLLTPAARRAISVAGDGGPYLMIVVRAHDRRKCEDLGRQLREMLRNAHGRFRTVLVTEDSATESYLAFVKREHLKARVVSLPLDSLMDGRSQLATPAVLVQLDPNGRIKGIAHPARFANVRTRSFAAEMQGLLASDDPPDTRVDRRRNSNSGF